MPYCHQCRKDFKVLPACPQCSLPLVPRATAGMVVSAIGGAIVLITGLTMLLFFPFYQWLLGYVGLGFLIPYGLMLVMIGIISGILMIIGGALMYLPGKERAGAALVFFFSIISLLVLGGFIIGATLGIVGTALGLARK